MWNPCLCLLHSNNQAVRLICEEDPEIDKALEFLAENPPPNWRPGLKYERCKLCALNILGKWFWLHFVYSASRVCVNLKNHSCNLQYFSKMKIKEKKNKLYDFYYHRMFFFQKFQSFLFFQTTALHITTAVSASRSFGAKLWCELQDPSIVD